MWTPTERYPFYGGPTSSFMVFHQDFRRIFPSPWCVHAASRCHSRCRRVPHREALALSLCRWRNPLEWSDPVQVAPYDCICTTVIYIYIIITNILLSILVIWYKYESYIIWIHHIQSYKLSLYIHWFISQIPHVSLVEHPISTHHAITCGHASYPLGTDHGSPHSLAAVWRSLAVRSKATV